MPSLRALDFSNRRDAAALFLLLAFVAAGPILYAATDRARPAMGGGAAGPAGDSLLALSAFLIAAVAFLSGSRPHRLRRLAVPLSATAALVLLGVVQLLPLPEMVLARIAPVNLRIYHETAQILRLFGGTSPPAPRISIDPSETWGVVLMVLAYAALFLAAADVLKNRPRRRLFAATLLASALAQIFFALVREPAERLRGLFENPNHFAGYLEIILALAFGALWSEVLTGADRASSAGHERSLEKRFLRLSGWALVWAIVATGIAMTRSRGGILAAGVTTLVLLGMAMLHRRTGLRRRAARGLALAFVAGVLFVAITTGPRPFQRFLWSDPRALQGELRVPLWKTSVEAWRQFPLLGSGLGTFPDAFRRVQPRDLNFLVEQAHSDFLQLLVTGGSLGAALGVLLFASLFFLLGRAWRRERHREESATVLAGFGALLSLTLHGLVEFNMSIPIIPAMLACALGAAFAAQANAAELRRR